MNKYQMFAVGYHLSEYPYEWDYDQILNALTVDDDKSREHVTVCEMFEDYPNELICEMINDMADLLEVYFIPKLEG
jgi:hypothetical protein